MKKLLIGITILCLSPGIVMVLLLLIGMLPEKNIEKSDKRIFGIVVGSAEQLYHGASFWQQYFAVLCTLIASMAFYCAIGFLTKIILQY